MEIDPTFPFGHFELAIDLLALGQPEAALREMELESPDTGKFSGLACVYHLLGRKTESNAALAEFTRDSAGAKPYEMALAHACRGEGDEAFDWLDRAYQQKDFALSAVKGEWLLRNWATDRRYTALLRKMNLPE